MTRVKICGIRDSLDLAAAVRAGADAVGFLVGLTHKSEDELSVEAARTLVALVPPFMAPVLVTHATEPVAIQRLAAATAVSTVQLQGDLAAPDLNRLRQLLPGLKLIKTIHVVPSFAPEDLITLAAQYEPFVDGLDLDSRTDDRLGGTGMTHDWTVSSIIRRSTCLPVVLSGGLTPENVDEAAGLVMPFAVDVNSGVENESGGKSLSKCQSFVLQAHGRRD